MIVAPERIAVAGPWITERESELAAEAARTAWFANHYAFNARFERMLADYVGVAHAVSLPHCTAALHLALAALGVGPDDEVIVPDVTWIASVAPVIYVGAEPVLVDILPDTWCLDPDAVETAIGPRTKAILGVDLYGSMCDWPRLAAIAERHGVALIEDAAEALGSSLNRRRAGAFGRVSAFSFHGSKTVATGEGGMLATDDADLHRRVLTLRDHGRPPGDRFFQNDEFAFKYRMNGVTAALGVAQMERIDALIERKRAIFGWYRDRLSDLNGVQINAEPPGVENSYWMVTAIPDADFGFDKFTLMAEFEKRNIDTRPFFSQLSSLPALDSRPAAKRFVSSADKGAHASRHGINLPSGYHVDEASADLVCRALKEILRL
jgi:perosamine synthetase